MTLFLKGCGAALIAVIMILAVGKQNREFGVILSLAACVFLAVSVFSFMDPVVDFIRQMQEMGSLDPELVGILLKTAGVGILGEIAAMICNDAGNGSLGKSVQYLGTAVILWLSLPLFSVLMDLIYGILEEL